MIAKLHPHDFEKNSLKILCSYLTNRWQGTKINTDFSSWTEIIEGVTQGSVICPIIFNLFLSDLFFLI